MQEKLDKMTIVQIEKQIKSSKENVHRNNLKFYTMLNYLEVTKRYKENKLYTTSTFQHYISDRFMMTYTTYLNGRVAYMRHSEVTRELGPNLVTKVRQRCGVPKAEKVFKEIKDTRKKKKNKFRREHVQEIIERHAKPVKQPAPKIDVKALQKQHERDQATIKLLNEEIRELKEQKDKLIRTVQLYKQQLSVPLENYITVDSGGNMISETLPDFAQ
jgi:hypothetical protein